MSVSREEFRAYECVRKSGATNMFDIKVVKRLSGLDRETIKEIMATYRVLKDKYGLEEE